MKKTAALTVLAVVLSLAGYRVYTRWQERQVQRAPRDPRIPVATAPVKTGRIVSALGLTGSVAPETEVTIFSSVGGEVVQLLRHEGDPVHRGQLIARVKCTQPELMVSQLKAGLAAAESSLATVQTSFDRARSLHERKAIADAQWEVAKAQYEAAQAQRDQVAVQLQMARSQQGDCSLRSPIDGLVSALYLHKGDLIAGAQISKSSPLATLITVGSVKVELAVDERDIGAVHIGQVAEVYVDAYPELPFPGEVSAITPTIDPRTRSAGVDVRIDNSEARLMPGMFARVRLIRAVHEGAVVIPEGAVLGREDHVVAYVMQAGLARERRLRLGIREANRVEVLSGLSAGERLVVFGQQRLRDSQAIKEGTLPPSARRALGLDESHDEGTGAGTQASRAPTAAAGGTGANATP